MFKGIKYQLYRFKYNYAPYLNLTKPVDISLELASYCTNRCGYCYHSDGKEIPFQRGYLHPDLAKKVIWEAADLGVHSIKFNYRGESTLHPKFEEITHEARRLANGSTFIDRLTNSNFNFAYEKESIFRGLCNQTKVKVSFDSFGKDIFEKQRAGSNYEKTLANMTKFYNYPGRDNIFVVQAVRTQANKDEDLEYEIKSRWPSATASIRDVVAGRTTKSISEIVVRKREEENRQSCIQAHARLIVNHDGKVTVCCPDIGSKLVVGDLNKESITTVWNSKKALEIRKSLKNKTAFEQDPCKTCSSFESYKNFEKRWDS